MPRDLNDQSLNSVREGRGQETAPFVRKDAGTDTRPAGDEKVKRRTTIGVEAVVVVALGCASIAWASKPDPQPAVPGQTALDYGFRFASAIDADPKDKQKAQQAVVMDYPELGLFDQASVLATRIEGWRRGVVLADLAALLAREHREEEARALLAQAERVRDTTPGWEGPRIAAHLADARAALGELEATRKIAGGLASADPQQYGGRAAVSAATAQAARGDFAEAMATLERLKGEAEFDVDWWRTVGFLAVAREERLDPADRRRALDAGRQSAEALAGLKQVEILGSLAEEYGKLGARDEASKVLTVASKTVQALPETDESRPALLASLARSFALTGENGRASALLSTAEGSVPRLLNLDRPALYAGIAASWSAIGDQDQMWRLYGKAFDAADALENARPRALAVVAICRSLGRSRIELTPETARRLDGILAGLKDPW